MSYFKINYNRLQNLTQVKFHIFITLVISIILLIILISCFIDVKQKLTFYGIYNDKVLKIKINNELSDIVKTNNHIKFNGQKLTYKVLSYGEYEIIENEIYQEVILTIEENLKNNEVGKIELYYNKQKLIKFIFELFK